MTVRHKELQQCPWCLGTGQHTVAGIEGGSSLVDCEHCGATGYLDWGYSQLADGLFNTCDVVEATDEAEYLALSESNKTRYKMIISVGTADLSDTSQIKSLLWNMFGEGTTTRDNLETLLEG